MSTSVRSLAVVLAFGALSGTALAQQEPRREITQIVGDLYRVQNNFHYSVFLVTPEGVIATDPIDAEAVLAQNRDRQVEREAATGLIESLFRLISRDPA